MVSGFFVTLYLSSGAFAADQQQAETSPDQPVDKGKLVEGEPAEVETMTAAILNFIEREKERTETLGHKAAQWVDSFFIDPEYEAEVAYSQFRVRPELYYRREQGLKPKIKLSFKLRLPNLERHVSLFGGNIDGGSDFDQEVDDDVKETVVGLQFLGKQREKWHASLSVGLKSSEFAGFIGPRFRYRTDWTATASFSFTQKVYWQTNNEWQIRSRFDFDVALSKHYFFRQMFDFRWRGEYSDREGYRTRVSSFLTRQLASNAGLQGEATVIFHTRPDTHVDKYVAALRYRKQTWRDWFYYEIAPQLSWEEKFDFKTNPGLRLRFEVFFGTNKDEQSWRRKAEDKQGFRW
jgi:hypothetical protein